MQENVRKCGCSENSLRPEWKPENWPCRGFARTHAARCHASAKPWSWQYQSPCQYLFALAEHRKIGRKKIYKSRIENWFCSVSIWKPGLFSQSPHFSMKPVQPLTSWRGPWRSFEPETHQPRFCASDQFKICFVLLKKKKKKINTLRFPQPSVHWFGPAAAKTDTPSPRWRETWFRVGGNKQKHWLKSSCFHPFQSRVSSTVTVTFSLDSAGLIWQTVQAVLRSTKTPARPTKKRCRSYLPASSVKLGQLFCCFKKIWQTEKAVFNKLGLQPELSAKKLQTAQKGSPSQHPRWERRWTTTWHGPGAASHPTNQLWSPVEPQKVTFPTSDLAHTRLLLLFSPQSTRT